LQTTRRYLSFDGHPLRDRLTRKGGRFSIIESPEPGGREVVKPISLRYAFQWLREMPEQIERNVITGGLAAGTNETRITGGTVRAERSCSFFPFDEQIERAVIVG
jgi:hypothetical protein